MLHSANMKLLDDPLQSLLTYNHTLFLNDPLLLAECERAGTSPIVVEG